MPPIPNLRIVGKSKHKVPLFTGMVNGRSKALDLRRKGRRRRSLSEADVCRMCWESDDALQSRAIFTPLHFIIAPTSSSSSLSLRCVSLESKNVLAAALIAASSYMDEPQSANNDAGD